MALPLKKLGRLPENFPANLEELQDLLKIISQAKRMWEATFDAISDPVFIINKNFTIERANTTAAEASSIKITKIVGNHCYEVFAKRKSPCPHCPLTETLSARKPTSTIIEDFIEGQDYQISSYPLLNGTRNSQPEQVIHHYRDVTEEKRLQKRMAQNEKMVAIGMLAGGVAHEINNPLAGILAFTQILKKSVPPENPIQSDLQEIEEAARRCKKIVEDLLLFSRSPASEDMYPLSVQETMERLLPLIRLQLHHKKVDLTTHYQNNLPLVMGSTAKLQQVFLNLIQNASQAMPQGGGIEIKMRVSRSFSREVIIEIKDRGQGIKKEYLPKIFDPFFTTKRMGEGTGLGLSISYSIIQDHRGKIEVDSTEGKGSTFRVILPALPPQDPNKGRKS